MQFNIQTTVEYFEWENLSKDCNIQLKSIFYKGFASTNSIATLISCECNYGYISCILFVIYCDIKDYDKKWFAIAI